MSLPSTWQCDSSWTWAKSKLHAGRCRVFLSCKLPTQFCDKAGKLQTIKSHLGSEFLLSSKLASDSAARFQAKFLGLSSNSFQLQGFELLFRKKKKKKTWKERSFLNSLLPSSMTLQALQSEHQTSFSSRDFHFQTGTWGRWNLIRLRVHTKNIDSADMYAAVCSCMCSATSLSLSLCACTCIFRLHGVHVYRGDLCALFSACPITMQERIYMYLLWMSVNYMRI